MVRIIDENVKIRNLLVSTCDDLPYNQRWFYTDDLINRQQIMKNKSFKQIDFLLRKSIISNQLKRLYVYRTKVIVKSLNSLDKLIHLEIHASDIERKADDVLKLPMLEILHLGKPKKSFCQDLIIDSPKLQSLKLGSFLDGWLH